ncbi:MAG: type II restriction enzyme [Alkaliphilus sp.]
MSNETKNDKAWKKIFGKYKIADEIKRNKFYIIKSSQINEYREARLMTKFDHKKNLPKLFVEHSLSILPITRGSYVISCFEAYHVFEDSHDIIEKVEIPANIESIDFNRITSESTAVNIAYITGMLADFIEEEDLLPTVDGRMSSEQFGFNIYNKQEDLRQDIEVVNSQVEIDGGYESHDSLTLLEAKNSISKDFLIRQLYYPFRLWSNKVSKKVRSVFLVYSNGIFSFYEYAFEDVNDYNSLILKKHKNYSLDELDISFDDILEVFKRVRIIKEPQEIPFPQANKFERVINLCEILYQKKSLTREDITYKYDFDVRQTNYYTDAARYLGLVCKKKLDGNITYFLTQKGERVLEKNYKQRNLLFVGMILMHGAFNTTFKDCIDKLEVPKRTEIVKIMEDSELYNVNSVKTYNRRSSTISGWINWILDLGR